MVFSVYVATNCRQQQKLSGVQDQMSCNEMLECDIGRVQSQGPWMHCCRIILLFACIYTASILAKDASGWLSYTC